MSDQSFKQLFTFILFMATVLWAIFSVYVTAAALDGGADNVMAAAGVDTFLGALLSWNVLTIQHWFRRAKPN